MNILIFSDPHLGVRRTAHTTPESSALLRQSIMMETLKICTSEQGMKADKIFCLGDLVDTYTNPESLILECVAIMPKLSLVLAGNHDVRNSKDSVGTVQLLSDLFPGKFIVNEWGSAESSHVDLGSTRFCFVPHVSSQQHFEEALKDAKEVARDCGKWTVLCLHCNYGRESLDLPDTELNLSQEMCLDLLNVFHKVWIGHEHTPRDLFEGRVSIIGNAHPTGFADLSDKRVLLYDTETGITQSVPHWKQENKVWAGPMSQLPEDPADFLFLDLVDDLEPGEAYKRTAKLFKELPKVLAIRLNSSRDKLKSTSSSVLPEAIDQLPAIVKKELKEKHPELLPLWEELLDEVKREDVNA